jgi:hypothetical protein
MAPYHVARSKLFVRERGATATLIHFDTAQIELLAPSRVPRSVRCREIWERVRHWAPAPVWLQVLLLEQAVVMPLVAHCK